jgi:hypothetical protein
MHNRQPQLRPLPTAEVIDFDEALLAACTSQLRDELLTEAVMLAHAFAPEGGPDDLLAMAKVLSSGDRDAEIGRARARQLAATLKRMAKDVPGTWKLLGRRG